MAEVRAFRGIRYAAGGTSLDDLIAPPYDAATAGMTEALLARSPLNAAHLERVDPEAGDRAHEAAAALYRDWRRNGVLVKEARSALYLHEEVATVEGETTRRLGVMAAVRLAPWSERVVLPHEATFPAAREERLRRLRTVGANLSPIYLLYRDPTGAIPAALEAARERPSDAEGVDIEQTRHRMWVLDDADVVAEVERRFAGLRLYVADGHHRYEAALAFCDERVDLARAASPEGAGAAAYVLALLVEAADPGVRVLPSHRLIDLPPGRSPAEIRARLAEHFRVEPAGPGTAPVSGHDIAVVCFAGEEEEWRLRPLPGSPHQGKMPQDRSEAWRGLAVAAVDEVVMRGALGIPPDQIVDRVRFTHDAGDARAAVEAGRALIALVLPAVTAEQVIAVADAGDRLPPKATYFWPKAPAGLVFRELIDQPNACKRG